MDVMVRAHFHYHVIRRLQVVDIGTEGIHVEPISPGSNIVNKELPVAEQATIPLGDLCPVQRTQPQYPAHPSTRGVDDPTADVPATANRDLPLQVLDVTSGRRFRARR